MKYGALLGSEPHQRATNSGDSLLDFASAAHGNALGSK